MFTRTFKHMAALASALVLTGALSFTALAASKINSVSVKFEIEGYGDDGFPEISATTSGSHYSVGTVDLETSSSDDEDAEIDYKTAKYSIDLSADDGYAFYITKTSQVKLNGCGATYVKASRQNSGTTLHVVLKFTDLDDFCGDISEVSWDDAGRLTWTPAQNAQRYKISVYKNDRTVKSSLYTGAATYDCRPLMLDAGSYTAKITPESGDEKGEAAYSGSISVTEEMADNNKAMYELKREAVVTGSGSGPDTITWNTLDAGWKHDGKGWWYQNDDGDYIQYNWLGQGEDWYFFGSDGYMITDTVASWGGADYYFGADGKMVKGTVIPDGRKAGADGKLSGKVTNAAGTNSLETETSAAIGPGISK